MIGTSALATDQIAALSTAQLNSFNRTQFGGGWFLTQTTLAKLEYVNQEYKDFPTTDIRHDGKFHGVMFEAVVSF